MAEAATMNDAGEFQCACGAAWFDSWDSVLAHAQQWHPDRVPDPPLSAWEERARLVAVEEAWYKETKGELQLVPEGEGEGDDLYDEPLARLALEMWRTAEEYIRTIDAQQWRAGVEVDDEQARADIPRRIARTLSTLMWGDA